MFKWLIKSLFCLCLAFVLASCGQTGPLYLPNEATPKPPPRKTIKQTQVHPDILPQGKEKRY